MTVQWIERDIEKIRQQAREIAKEETAQERAVLARQHQEALFQNRVAELFRTLIDGQFVADNRANRMIIESWVNPGEVIGDPVQWFIRVLKEQPQLKQQLAWTKPVDRKAKAQEQADQLKADHQKFEDFCKSTEICAISEANFQILRDVLGAGLPNLSISVVQLPTGPVLLDEEGNEHSLMPASQVDVAQWAQERFQADQENLAQMNANNDIQGLRARARRDRERTSSVDQALEFQLSKGYEKEVLQQRKVTPLPQTWLGKPLDATFIRTLDRSNPNTKLLVERFGFARLNARLHGVKAVRQFDNVGNPIDGAAPYVFEN